MFSSIADTHQQKQAQQRLLSGQQQQEYTEDKKCRICGFADTKNVNIFSQTSCKALVTKILTVYPIVLYKNDPLPKNICKKCICNVSIMYNDILRVMKTQSKWIKNVRNVQPRHNYIRVLDMIESSNNVTKDSIKASLGEEINELTVERLLLSNKVDFLPTESINVSKETNAPPKLVAPKLSAPSQITSLSFSMDFDDNVVKTISHSTTAKTGETAEMKDIKSLLELNGCSLLQVGANKATIKSSTQLSNDSGDAPIISIKKEIIDAEDNDDNKILDLMPPASTSKNCSISSPISPGPPPPLTIKCRMCPLQFNSLASLATHQVIHMRVCVPKIFQKKYLHKKIRRGRLISVNGRKCIRCLNCWRILVDNKAILEHWAMGECDFYCHICGKEFAQAPKMLREHVPAAHGISYKSSKFHRVRLSTKIMMSMAQTPLKENPDFKLYVAASEQEPLPLEAQGDRNEISKEKFNMKPTSSATAYASTKYKKSSKSGSLPGKTRIICNEDGSVACHICSKVFQNFKARNSHMRKHKPVYAYGDMVLPPLQGVNVYMKEQAKNNEFKYRSPGVEIACQKTKTNYPNYSFSSTPPPAPTPPIPTPPLSSSPQTSSAANANIKPVSAVRGVRTKFVQPREFNGGTLKVKPLTELQKQSSPSPSTFSSSNPFSSPSPSSSSNTSNAWLPTAPNISNNQNHSEIDPLATKIKEEPMDSDPTDSSAQNQPHHQQPQHHQQQQHQQQQHQQQQQQQQQHQQQQHHQQHHHQQQQQHQQQQPTVFTCIPCSEQFPSKLELFRHKRKCHAAYSFTCVYCLALFRCSADYQLHVAQVHRKYS